jgi:hypothetical protein
MKGLQINVKAPMGCGKTILAVEMAKNAAVKGYTLFAAPEYLIEEFPEYINVNDLYVGDIVVLVNSINENSCVILDKDYLKAGKDPRCSADFFEPLLAALLTRGAVVIVLSSEASSTPFSVDCSNPRARQFLLLNLLGVQLANTQYSRWRKNVDEDEAE